MAGPKVQLEVPSYKSARELSVEVRVVGEGGSTLLVALGVSSDDVKVSEAIDGTTTFTAKVQPFARFSGSEYTKWIAELLRGKLSEGWWHRW